VGAKKHKKKRSATTREWGGEGEKGREGSYLPEKSEARPFSGKKKGGGEPVLNSGWGKRKKGRKKKGIIYLCGERGSRVRIRDVVKTEGEKKDRLNFHQRGKRGRGVPGFMMEDIVGKKGRSLKKGGKEERVLSTSLRGGEGKGKSLQAEKG